jgi:UDP-N-acetylmuramate dehydrogenase
MRFGYRDSVFKHGAPVTIERAGAARHGAGGPRASSPMCAFVCPRPWKPELGYLDLERRRPEAGVGPPRRKQIFDWVCEIRRAKLPDPAVMGNAGSFFKNPTVTPEQCSDIIARDPKIVHYPMPDGSHQAGRRLADRCLRLEGQDRGQGGRL